MFVNIEAFFLNALADTQAVYLLDAIEQSESTGSSPKVNHQNAEQFSSEESKVKFAKRLKEAMERVGMNQVELSRKSGITKSGITQYVSGKYEAKQEALYLIAKALDVNEAWLMGHDVPKERNITESDLSVEVRLLDQISLRFGKSAVQALSILNELNEDGQKKALSALEDLSEIPKYRKDDDS